MNVKPNNFRIIGGKWRGRQLSIANHSAVRPTLNNVRETLFNWLMNDIHGAVCLDTFAGTGALGIEALSRGAKQVFFIEKEKSVLAQLEKNLALLKTDSAHLILGNMPESLSNIQIENKNLDLDPSPEACEGRSVRRQADEDIDIVFLDPPFHQNLILLNLRALKESQLLKPDALIYAEAEKELDLESQLGPCWNILKHKKAGKVAYYLLKRVLK
jgi:16S rRNA (guanine966-N2)-methyltransferase